MGSFRLLRTAAHLRPRQLVDRVARAVTGRSVGAVGAAAPRLAPRGPVPPARRRGLGWEGGGFRFLNQALPFRGGERWRPAAAPALWVYNLHYFRFLWEMPPAAALALMENWVAANPPGVGPGWEPYPAALRVREWIEWLHAHPEAPAARTAPLLASLADQTAALEAQLEYHLLGNHLLEDAVTLCWAGLSLECPEAAAWRFRGLELLAGELAVQCLPDGCHDERSPMYQAQLAEGLLRLAVVAGAAEGPAAARIRGLAGDAGERMLGALARLTHPDGEIALLNDAALGEAPTLARLGARFGGPGAAAAGPGGWLLADGGYGGWRRGGTALIFDGGPLGPDHQPGHGHADCLSFELSHRGRRLVTDTGTSTYEPSDRRLYQRGTAAHSTVAVDGRDQAELWAAFRCGRRPRVAPLALADGDGGATLRGAYRASGGALGEIGHRRAVRVSGAELAAVDEVAAPGAHRAVVRLHLAPGITAAAREGFVELRDGGVAVARVAGELEWRVGESRYAPEFGREVDRACLSAEVEFRDRFRAAWRIALDGEDGS